MNGSIKMSGYDTFRCTADECPFTCCQEWKIGVDEATYLKWKGKKLKGQTKGLCEQVKASESDQMIALDESKQCPFLDEKGLCRVVLEYGEDHLSQTCTTFPRQINVFKDRTEYSLDLGCPAVIDKMREQKTPISFEQVGIKEMEDASLVRVRQVIIEILQKEGYTLPERMMIAFYVLLELLEKQNLSVDEIASWEQEEKLEPVAQAIRKMAFHNSDTLYESNALFLDVVENYRKQKLYVAYLEEIAKLAEQLEQEEEGERLEAYEAFEPLFVPYENLVKNDMVSEVFGSMLTEGATLEDMVIVFQWISMVYAVMRQAIFLKWLQEGQQPTLDYTIVRDYMMIIARVTGYDQEDIREYLENSFEEVIWEWGYQALIIGNNRI